MYYLQILKTTKKKQPHNTLIFSCASAFLVFVLNGIFPRLLSSIIKIRFGLKMTDIAKSSK